ncbi:MAG: hypothetical protein K2K72_04700 [Duncaniella sp.]|nr:hypothetical protein [Duncaniella sp.]
MANSKRDIKKEIYRICGALAGECVVAKLTVPGIDKEALNKCIYDLAELQMSALKLVSVDFPGSEKSYGSRKEYVDARRAYYRASFAKLRQSFNSRIEEILHEMNVALKAARK